MQAQDNIWCLKFWRTTQGDILTLAGGMASVNSESFIDADPLLVLSRMEK